MSINTSRDVFDFKYSFFILVSVCFLFVFQHDQNWNHRDDSECQPHQNDSYATALQERIIAWSML